MAAPGTSLGPYEILGSIGAGGMGEVYRAHDPRLGRDVAIKVLPPQFAADAERLRRFEQEARAAAALNHPNILAIYDLGTQPNGSPYIVSELLEGESLRDKLCLGPLPLRKVMDYAAQIARGLAAAHAKGIVHRDLKPENLFLTRDGRIKILDFGLAKLTERNPQDAASSAPTEVTGTTPGVVLGTVGYMSPEQVRGEEADARSDLFSLGVILFEMVSGQRCFRADSVAETMSAILRDDPPAFHESRQAPPALERIIRHCLEKSPADRFQSASDLAFQLESAAGSSTSAAPAIHAPRRVSATAMLAALIAVVAASLAVIRWRARMPGKVAEFVRVSRLTDLVGLEEFPALSPDGKYVAFTSDSSGTPQVMIRLLSGGAPLQITRDAAVHESPRWSADSSSLLFYSEPAADQLEGTVWQVSALGGAPRRLFSSLSDADFSHDGKSIAYFGLNGDKVELRVMDAAIGTTRVLQRFAPDDKYSHPRWSPDDAQIAFQHGAWPGVDILRIPSAGGEVRPISAGPLYRRGFAWLPDGSGVVMSSAEGSTVFYQPTLNLWVQPLNGGAPRQLTFGDNSYVEPDMARGGTLVASRVNTRSDIWKFPVTGSPADNVRNAVQITHQTGLLLTPSVSPDGKQMVYLADTGGHGNLWVRDTGNGEVRQLTFESDPATVVGVPIWSPDGRHIVFVVIHSFVDWSSTSAEWLVDADGSNLRKLADDAAWASWSPDGAWVYYAASRGAQNLGIRKVAPAAGQVVQVRPEREAAIAPVISPDNKTLYFVLNSSWANGMIKSEIRAATAESGEARLLTTIPGSLLPEGAPLIQPVPSPDGKWLAVILRGHNADEVWALPTGRGELHRLTDFGPRRTLIARRVSWSPDGRSIFAAVGDEDADIVALQGLLQH